MQPVSRPPGRQSPSPPRPLPGDRHLLAEQVVAHLRERLYGAISCLATLVILTQYSTANTNAWARALDVALAAGGLWAASLLADWVAHLGAYGRIPGGREMLGLLQSSGQILEACVVPLILLCTSGFGWLSTSLAMWVAIWALVAQLGLITLVSVRRAELRFWQQIVAVVALAGVGTLVVAVKMLAH